jgi:2-polyprenyl-6-methoxyphenol hydroxylase-like FAD-dependent oxidoreductase
MSAILLARQNVPSLIVERRATRSSAPKAHALNPRSLEICRSAGLDLDAIYARKTPAEESGYVRFVSRLAGEEIGALPYERQDEAVRRLTPMPLINIAQPDFEDIVVDRIVDEQLITLRLGAEWKESKEREDGVESLIRHENGTTSLVRSDYVIACDGAASRVRASLGVAMEGERVVQHSLSIHFSADLSALMKDRPAILYWILDPAASGTFIVYNLASNFVFVHSYDPEREPLETFTPERLRSIISAAIGDPSIDFTVQAANPWVMTAQVASRYRVGRIFLAGDAAHRFPPSGGLGLNTGVADAHNLAWKIGAMRRGWYDDSLLDTYESERRPVALANTAQSLLNSRQIARLFESVRGSSRGAPALHTFRERMADPAGRAEIMDAIAAQREHFDSLALQLGYVYGEGAEPPPDVSVFEPVFRRGARLPHAWIERGGRRMSTLDLVDEQSFVLLVGEGDQVWRAATLAAPMPVRVVELGIDFLDPEGEWTAQSGLSSGGALLVRPDGHIALAARSPHSATADLSDALARPAAPAPVRDVAAA